MSELPESLFSNPVWHSLHGPHRHLARTEGGACRYPADVVPFAAIDALECVQMVLPSSVDVGAPSREVLPLSAAHAPEMVALTDVAFPGFFRPGTYLMGSYFGVRVRSDLIAMGGERLLLPGHPEMSAVCTHPEHRGEGFATDVIRHLARLHRRAGLVSWLHVGAANQRAIDLYASLGFERVRSLMLHRITRTG